MQVAYPLLRAGMKRALPAIARAFRGRAAKRIALAAGSAASGYAAYKANQYGGGDSNVGRYSAAGTSTSNYASVNTQRKRKRRLNRRGRRIVRRRKIRNRKFTRKVVKVLRGEQKMSWLQDQSTATPGVLSGQTVATVSAFNNLASLTRLQDGRQFVMGGSSQYCLMPGPAWSTTTGLGYIKAETIDFSQDINGVAVQKSALSGNQLKIWVSKCRLEVTIENVSSLNIQTPPTESWTPCDITCDVYEFVAAMDITDSSYRSVKDAMYTLFSSSTSVNTAVPTTDASIPANMFTLKGTTPLQVRDLGKYWKLIGKTRVSVPYNTDQGIWPYQKLTYSSRKHLVDFKKWKDLYAKKGVTKNLLFIFEPDLTSDKLLSTPAGTANVPYANIWSHKDWHFKPVNGSMIHSSISLPNVLQSQTSGSVN